MDNCILDRFQSAYRHGHSCETALLRVMNDVLCAADRGDLTLLVLLDLSAAFDIIDHEILLSRFRNEVGITGTALHWFSSYLADITQRVIVNLLWRITGFGFRANSILGVYKPARKNN